MNHDLAAHIDFYNTCLDQAETLIDRWFADAARADAPVNPSALGSIVLTIRRVIAERRALSEWMKEEQSHRPGARDHDISNCGVAYDSRPGLSPAPMPDETPAPEPVLPSRGATTDIHAGAGSGTSQTPSKTNLLTTPPTAAATVAPASGPRPPTPKDTRACPPDPSSRSIPQGFPPRPVSFDRGPPGCSLAAKPNREIRPALRRRLLLMAAPDRILSQAHRLNR